MSTKIQALKKLHYGLVDTLLSLVDKSLDRELSPVDVSEINKPVIEAIEKTKRSIVVLEKKLKKEARSKLIKLTAECLVANGYELTEDKIWEVADIVSASYNNPDDLREGREFTQWYLESLNESGKWSSTQGKLIHPKQTRFFNDVRKSVIKKGN